MKKILSLLACSFFIGISFFNLIPANASGLNDAFNQSNLNQAANGYDTSGKNDVYQIVGTIINTLLSLLGVIFIVLLIYGGITWMTAEGDESKVEKAQIIIRNAVIGLIIIVSAYAISYFVINAFNKAR
jgi:hypothetical protein